MYTGFVGDGAAREREGGRLLVGAKGGANQITCKQQQYMYKCSLTWKGYRFRF